MKLLGDTEQLDTEDNAADTKLPDELGAPVEEDPAEGSSSGSNLPTKIKRYVNAIGSEVSTITFYPEGKCGQFAPYFTEFTKYGGEYSFSLDKLAMTLNFKTRSTIIPRTISEELEQEIVEDFGNFLEIVDDEYVYTGPSYKGARRAESSVTTKKIVDTISDQRTTGYKAKVFKVTSDILQEIN